MFNNYVGQSVCALSQDFLAISENNTNGMENFCEKPTYEY